MLKQDDELSKLRHSAAHVMAQAVKHLFPEAKVTIGPPIEDGFYYDFDVARPFTPEDLEKIEAEMQRNIAADVPFERRPIAKRRRSPLFQKMDEPYKVEMISETPDDEPMSVYQHGDFVDWCRGPHVRARARSRRSSCSSVAGAYWRGDEKHPMLQRIYGTAFFTRRSWTHYLQRLEEAKRRDHRRLGRELGLFMFIPTVGAGPAALAAEGRHRSAASWSATSRTASCERGYQHVITPDVGEGGPVQDLRPLGALPGRHVPDDGARRTSELVLRPMNCPHHIQIYRHEQRSYRELPLRWPSSARCAGTRSRAS